MSSAKTGKTPKEAPWLDYISPGYFETMQTPLLAGRDISGSDTVTSFKVAVVNESFVKKFLKSAKDPVGKQFRLWEPPGKPEPYYKVVGVVKDSVYNDMHQPFVPIAYLARAQVEKPQTDATFLIRSQVGLASLLNSVRGTTAGVNPAIDVQFKVLRTQIRESLVQDELMATLCGFFGVLAVTLAAIGLYGVISYTVAKRTNEIGIRMALGAQRSGVIGLILREVAVLIAIGVVVGVGLTLAGSKASGSLLFGLKPHDPLTLVLAIVVLATLALRPALFRRGARLESIL